MEGIGSRAFLVRIHGTQLRDRAISRSKGRRIKFVKRTAVLLRTDRSCGADIVEVVIASLLASLAAAFSASSSTVTTPDDKRCADDEDNDNRYDNGDYECGVVMVVSIRLMSLRDICG